MQATTLNCPLAQTEMTHMDSKQIDWALILVVRKGHISSRNKPHLETKEVEPCALNTFKTLLNTLSCILPKPAFQSGSLYKLSRCFPLEVRAMASWKPGYCRKSIDSMVSVACRTSFKVVKAVWSAFRKRSIPSHRAATGKSKDQVLRRFPSQVVNYIQQTCSAILYLA